MKLIKFQEKMLEYAERSFWLSALFSISAFSVWRQSNRLIEYFYSLGDSGNGAIYFIFSFLIFLWSLFVLMFGVKSAYDACENAVAYLKGAKRGED